MVLDEWARGFPSIHFSRISRGPAEGINDLLGPKVLVPKVLGPKVLVPKVLGPKAAVRTGWSYRCSSREHREASWKGSEIIHQVVHPARLGLT
jgi:hypothetical protein